MRLELTVIGREWSGERLSVIKKNDFMPWQDYNCCVCSSIFRRYVRPNRSDKAKVTCSKECLKQHRTKIFSGKNNPAYRKTYRTKRSNPEWAQKISEGLIRNCVNVGNKNGMKKPEFREKASKSAKRKFENPEMRKLISHGVAKAWARGDFDGVRVGQCDWHDFTKKDGTVIKLQGLWELEYARYLDANGINFEVHRGRLKYIDDAGVERSYYPDFYLPDVDKYVDVKNPFYQEKHARKIELVRQFNSVNLVVLGKDELQSFGIRLSGVSND